MAGNALIYKYDPVLDVMMIEGVRFSGDFFRDFAVHGPGKIKFRIVSEGNFQIVSNDDGVIVMKAADEPDIENARRTNP